MRVSAAVFLLVALLQCAHAAEKYLPNIIILFVDDVSFCVAIEQPAYIDIAEFQSVSV